MKRMLALTAAVFFATSPLSAQVTFDDLPGGSTAISNPYQDLTWNNLFSIDGCDDIPSSGYCSGTVSPNITVFNGFGSPASITSATSFFFGGAWFAGAWNDGLEIEIRGLLDGNELFSATVVANAASAFFVANWDGIDELSFTSFGGTLRPNQTGSGTQFVMDDLYVTRVDVGGDVVPEPATMTLLATGLAGMAAARRRRKA